MPWSRLHFQILIRSTLLKKLPTFYELQVFITAVTTGALSYFFRAKLIRSTSSCLISLRSILLLISHLRLCLPNGLFLSGLPIISCMYISISLHATCPAHLTVLGSITKIIFVADYKLWSSSLWNFLQSPDTSSTLHLTKPKNLYKLFHQIITSQHLSDRYDTTNCVSKDVQHLNTFTCVRYESACGCAGTGPRLLK
jgi:hypothetical protein